MSISSSTRGCTSSHGVDSAAICVLACRLVFPCGTWSAGCCCGTGTANVEITLGNEVFVSPGYRVIDSLVEEIEKHFRESPEYWICCTVSREVFILGKVTDKLSD